MSPDGEVPEWSNGTVSKTVVRVTVPWVRIPPSPPVLSCFSISRLKYPLANQWAPALYRDTTPIEMEIPKGREGNYTLNDALADETIKYIDP
jgi:hypothetical protein